jgi:hypothetical protein
VTSLSLGLGLVLIAAQVMVEGDSACPNPDAVHAELSPLLPQDDQAQGQRPDVARVDLTADHLTVTLRSALGVLIGRRTLSAGGSCEERARAVAVILGTWESDVHPAFQGGAPPAAVAPTPAPPEPAAELAAGQASSAAVKAPLWDLGVAIAGVLASTQVTAGASIVATATPWSRWGARLAVDGEADHSISVGSGEGRWSRWSASLGPQYRVAFGGWSLEGNLSVDASRYDVRGQGYPITYATHGIQAGASAGLRLLAPGRRWRPWIAVEGTRWLGRQTVVELVAGQERAIPSWTQTASLGLSFFGR